MWRMLKKGESICKQQLKWKWVEHCCSHNCQKKMAMDEETIGSKVALASELWKVEKWAWVESSRDGHWQFKGCRWPTLTSFCHHLQKPGATLSWVCKKTLTFGNTFSEIILQILLVESERVIMCFSLVKNYIKLGLNIEFILRTAKNWDSKFWVMVGGLTGDLFIQLTSTLAHLSNITNHHLLGKLKEL